MAALRRSASTPVPRLDAFSAVRPLLFAAVLTVAFFGLLFLLEADFFWPFFFEVPFRAGFFRATFFRTAFFRAGFF